MIVFNPANKILMMILTLPSYKVISLRWLIKAIKEEVKKAFFNSKSLSKGIVKKINFQDIKKNNKIVVIRIKDKGIPKLCASSRVKLWECSAFTGNKGTLKVELLFLFKKEKVEEPQPQKGLSWILAKADCQMSNLGDVL